MKRMDRYIIRELIVPFVAGSFAIALLFGANQLIFILKTFSIQHVPPSAMALMIFYRMPYWLNMTLPAGVALAGSLAITRLARESEITAMRTVGVRVIRVVFPVMLFGLFVAAGNYLLVEKIMPKSEQMARRLEVDTTISSGGPRFASNVWLTLKQYHATFGSVTRMPDDSLKIENVILGDRPRGDTASFFSSPTGTYRNGIWTFQNGRIWNISPMLDQLDYVEGQTVVIPQPLFINDLFNTGLPQEPQDKPGAELLASIKAGKEAGRDMTMEEVYLHERFSVPAACIVFAIVSPIFSIMFAKTGSFAGVLLSFVLVLLYYNGYVISTEIFGRNHWLSPWLAAWAPNLIFAGLGILGVRRLE
jgi:lipopolysaccharide export system permease protein